MTNREQLAFSLAFGDYDNKIVADILSDFADAVGGSLYFERENIEKWLGLECDKETNNWGELELEDESEVV